MIAFKLILAFQGMNIGADAYASLTQSFPLHRSRSLFLEGDYEVQ